jgi:hypothetical protein
MVYYRRPYGDESPDAKHLIRVESNVPTGTREDEEDDEEEEEE